MRVRLDYGREGLEVEVPDSAQVLHMSPTSGLEEVDRRLQEALQYPIGTPSLKTLAQNRKNACIVIADITRPVPNSTILPPMLRILEEEGESHDEKKHQRHNEQIKINRAFSLSHSILRGIYLPD